MNTLQSDDEVEHFSKAKQSFTIKANLAKDEDLLETERRFAPLPVENTQDFRNIVTIDGTTHHDPYDDSAQTWDLTEKKRRQSGGINSSVLALRDEIAQSRQK